jgi:hypothetical protein
LEKRKIILRECDLGTPSQKRRRAQELDYSKPIETKHSKENFMLSDNRTKGASAPFSLRHSKCSWKKKRVLFPFILPGLFDLEGLGAGAGFKCTSPSYQQGIDFIIS